MAINFTFSKPAGATSVVLQQFEDDMWNDLQVQLDENSTTATVQAVFGKTVKYRLAVVGGNLAGYSNEITVTALEPV